MCIIVHVYMSMCVCVYVYMCICAYMYICVCVYVCISKNFLFIICNTLIRF